MKSVLGAAARRTQSLTRCLLSTFSSDAFTSLSLGVEGRISVGSPKNESEKLKGCRQVQRGTVRLLLLRPAHFQCTLPQHSLQLSGFTFALIVLCKQDRLFYLWLEQVQD